jgi:hypothetical protein
VVAALPEARDDREHAREDCDERARAVTARERVRALGLVELLDVESRAAQHPIVERSSPPRTPSRLPSPTSQVKMYAPTSS